MVHDLDSKGSIHQMVEGNNCVLGHMPLMHYCQLKVMNGADKFLFTHASAEVQECLHGCQLR